MKDIADKWISQNMHNAGPFSRIRFFIRDQGTFRIYLGFVTNREISIRNKWISSTTLVTCEKISREKLLSMLPDAPLNERERFDLSLEYKKADGTTESPSRRTDVRLERSDSNSPLSWGSSKSFLQFEHWLKDSDVPTGSDPAKDALNNEIFDIFGVGLDKYSDHIGNCIIQLEDDRARIQHQDGWQVRINESLVNPSNVKVATEIREYGELLWRSVANSRSSNPSGSNTALGEIEVNYDSGSDILTYENFKPPGANEPDFNEVGLVSVNS